MSLSRPNRRLFLQKSIRSTSILSIPFIIPSQALGLGKHIAANDRINLGVIGIGRRCKKVLRDFLSFPEVQCTAIADVQQERREEGKAMVDEHHQNQDCRIFRDFRELLNIDDIDAVLIATGDRWHAAASILAAEAGKDVYSEKPCGITIADCQNLAKTIDETGQVLKC